MLCYQYHIFQLTFAMAASPSEIGMLSRSAAVSSSNGTTVMVEKVDDLLSEKVTKEVS